MIGIKAIASHVPSTVIDNVEQAGAFGQTAEYVEKKLGGLLLPTIEPGEEASDIARLAVEQLCADSGLPLEDIDALIVVTQNPDGSGLPHCSAILQAKLGLRTEVAAFDMSLGCSGFVYGLSALRGLMLEAGLENGVLVTADPYSKVVDREDRVTSLLFGDAATATWLAQDSPWRIGRPILQTDGTGAEALFVEGGRLHMDGRQVFNFAAVTVPSQIARWLELNNLAPEDIDLFCLHQGSAAIVDAVARRFPTVRDRFVKDLARTGNTVSSSIPLLLQRHLADRSIRRVLMSGFGVGLSWATNVIERLE